MCIVFYTCIFEIFLYILKLRNIYLKAYNMSRNPRGIALILNNSDFHGDGGVTMAPRAGSERDVTSLDSLLKKTLHFHTEIKQNLSAQVRHSVTQYIQSKHHCCLDACHPGHQLVFPSVNRSFGPNPGLPLGGPYQSLPPGDLAGVYYEYLLLACQGCHVFSSLFIHSQHEDLSATSPNRGDGEASLPSSNSEGAENVSQTLCRKSSTSHFHWQHPRFQALFYAL